jgi:hypothetical protein
MQSSADGSVIPTGGVTCAKSSDNLKAPHQEYSVFVTFDCFKGWSKGDYMMKEILLCLESSKVPKVRKTCHNFSASFLQQSSIFQWHHGTIY